MLALKHEDGEAAAHLSVRLLNPSTKIANNNKREEIIKEVILELKDTGLLGWYEFYTMQAPNSIKGWKVDFATNLVYHDGGGDRLVVIEPHGNFKQEESEKIRRIREAYNLFVILISKKEPILTNADEPSHKIEFFDQYWQMPNHLSDEDRAGEEKGRMKKMLSNFIADGHIRIISREEAQRMLWDRIIESRRYEKALHESMRKV